MKEHQLKFLKVKIMPRCTVDADFLKSVLEDAKAAGRWADASYQLFLKKGEIPEHAMRRIQQDECILNIPLHRKYFSEIESGEWLNENCTTLEMQLKACQHLCEYVTTRLSVVLEECDYYDQERRNTIHLAPARTQQGRQVTIPPEVDAILAKMMENAEKEKKA